MLYPLGGKIFFEKTLYFSRSRALPFEGIFRKFRKPFIKSAFSCSTTWGRKIFTAKARFLIILVAYLLREEKYIFSKGLIFSLSRDLPLEGRKLQNRHNFWPLPVGTSEEIFETGVKKHSSRCLPFEERKIKKHPAKWLSPLGISEEKNNSIKAALFAISRWLLFGGIFESNSRGSLTGEYVKKLWIFRKTPPKTASPSGNKWEVNFWEGPKKHPL